MSHASAFDDYMTKDNNHYVDGVREIFKKLKKNINDYDTYMEQDNTYYVQKVKRMFKKLKKNKYNNLA